MYQYLMIYAEYDTSVNRLGRARDKRKRPPLSRGPSVNVAVSRGDRAYQTSILWSLVSWMKSEPITAVMAAITTGYQRPK